MTLKITATAQFKKDFKLSKKRNLKIELLEQIIELIVSGSSLPEKYKLHKLTGNWHDCWECHIQPDWLLIFRVASEELQLIRTGTHSDLF